jgi:hypothetical protein
MVQMDGTRVTATAARGAVPGTDSITSDYTSARISTKGRHAFRYGRFEARLQTPVGRGLWPAFWALGTDIDRSGWPECGEIDVMENLGHEPTKASGTIHGPREGAGPRADYGPGHSVWHTAPLSQQFIPSRSFLASPVKASLSRANGVLPKVQRASRSTDPCRLPRLAIYGPGSWVIHSRPSKLAPDQRLCSRLTG